MAPRATAAAPLLLIAVALVAAIMIPFVAGQAAENDPDGDGIESCYVESETVQPGQPPVAGVPNDPPGCDMIHNIPLSVTQCAGAPGSSVQCTATSPAPFPAGVTQTLEPVTPPASRADPDFSGIANPHALGSGDLALRLAPAINPAFGAGGYPNINPDANWAWVGNCARAFASDEVDNGNYPFPWGDVRNYHLMRQLNDGFYNNQNSWIGDHYAGVRFPVPIEIDAFAMGRDATGHFSDRGSFSTPTVQVTTHPHPDGVTVDADWHDLVHAHRVVSGRNYFDVANAEGVPSGFQATGIRILVEAGFAIDEIEVFGTPDATVAGLQEDTDGDGVSDACDADADGDGCPNAFDSQPFVAGADHCDDADNDGCRGGSDPNPGTFSPDNDQDGFGQDCDCNDADNHVHPAASDADCNGIDDNCDGAPDNEEVDVDNDSVDRCSEVAAGTDPNNPDTDGDSFPDGVDLDPLDPAVGIEPVCDATGVFYVRSTDTFVRACPPAGCAAADVRVTIDGVDYEAVEDPAEYECAV